MAQAPPHGYHSWPDLLRAHGVPEEEWNRAAAIVDPGGGPRLYIQRVAEPKTVKNRVHLPNRSGEWAATADRRRQIDAEVERLTGLGAEERYRHTELGTYWVTMADPESNEFCVQ